MMATQHKFKLRGRVALTRDLADVQEVLAEMAESVQQFDAEEKQRWTELRAEETRLWQALQTLNVN